MLFHFWDDRDGDDDGNGSDDDDHHNKYDGDDDGDGNESNDDHCHDKDGGDDDEGDGDHSQPRYNSTIKTAISEDGEHYSSPWTNKVVAGFDLSRIFTISYLNFFLGKSGQSLGVAR